MSEVTEGFRETKHRPWPPGVVFKVSNIHPQWLDLCYVRPSDGAVVYLCTKPNPAYVR